MPRDLINFRAIFFSGLALVPAAAHAMEYSHAACAALNLLAFAAAILALLWS